VQSRPAPPRSNARRIRSSRLGRSKGRVQKRRLSAISESAPYYDNVQEGLLFIGTCRIASQSSEPRPSNTSVRQNRLKTVLAVHAAPMTDIRIALSDKAIAQLPTPEDGWYLARDTELKGFFVVVGKRKRTFTVQGDIRQQGK